VSSDEDVQQQPATGTDHDDDRAVGTSESATHDETEADHESGEQDSQPSGEALAANVQQAITALQEIEQALEAA
jgi:hypothetical protein